MALGRPTRNTSPGMPSFQRDVPRTQGQDQLRALFADQQEEVGDGGQIRQQGGDRRARDLEAQEGDEDRVEDHVEDAAHGHAEAGLLRIALGPHQMGEGGAEHGRHRADGDHPEGVLTAVAIGRRVGADQRKENAPESVDQQAVDQSGAARRPEAERGGPSGVVSIPFAERAGDQAGAADAEQVRHPGQQHEQRQTDGRRRDLIRVADLPDEEGVRHVVHDGDQLADDRRHLQRHDRLQDRRLFKELPVFMFDHGASPSRVVFR